VKNSLVALAVLACVRTAGAAILCPTTVQPGDQFAAEVTLDTGFSALGAYSVMLNYDPSAVTVVTVDGGSAPEFTVPPVVNTFAPGSLVISDFQAHSLTSPSGTVSVARVNLTAARFRITSMQIVVRSVYDTDAVAIPGVVGGSCTIIRRRHSPPPLRARTQGGITKRP